ncbi:MAG: hypothetical protein KJ876_07800 [Alphaproteobacteria bacterium]|nr:hypothetical protein [Alphaproteobacteria bacterium]MBU0774226.1 hypothetical protein [Alphaproteobacteria bacterium]MBU0868032.1 hypothetical protein [Alphaproteobacteria bacterium]MBU1257531.1 hypothetical protein [Alphaproteobacteria bacterium]MBU1464466.1 hypothetical protein [Alphaproteobacteria bacterium]
MKSFCLIAAKISTLLMALAVVGCIAGPELNTPVLAEKSEQLRIMWTHVYPDKRGLLLLGQVRRPALSIGLLGGHLHVVGHLSDGSPPVVVDTRWGSMSKRGSHMASFGALLRSEHPELIDMISVEYRARPEK